MTNLLMITNNDIPFHIDIIISSSDDIDIVGNSVCILVTITILLTTKWWQNLMMT